MCQQERGTSLPVEWSLANSVRHIKRQLKSHQNKIKNNTESLRINEDNNVPKQLSKELDPIKVIHCNSGNNSTENKPAKLLKEAKMAS